MIKVTYKPPSPEMLAKIRKAQNAVEGQTVKELRCPYCGHRMADTFVGSQGYVKEKCTKCGKECVVDLVSWRRASQISFRRMQNAITRL